jgi:hypothetical protein
VDKIETTIEIHEVTDPGEVAKANELREQFDRNSAWLECHVSEIYPPNRGKVICIAGQEVFVGDTTSEVIAKAKAAHPDEEGWFTRYIPKEKVARVYAV